MMRLAMTTVCAALACGSAVAKPVFSCTSTTGQLVEISKNANNEFVYFFGRKGKPELTFKLPRKAVNIDLGTGFGRYRSYTLVMPTRDATFLIYYNRDSISTDAPEAGIDVSIGHKVVRRVNCAKDKPIDEAISGEQPDRPAQ
ncbi:MAG: hypothetical protein ACLGI6_18945 [Gammaproteobacteria bacterium]